MTETVALVAGTYWPPRKMIHNMLGERIQMWAGLSRQRIYGIRAWPREYRCMPALREDGMKCDTAPLDFAVFV